jgi:hypothetical protein
MRTALRLASTTHRHHGICRGQKLDEQSPEIRLCTARKPAWSPPAALAGKLQRIDSLNYLAGAKLGIASFLPAWTLLSDRMYKICTLLSTGFVDNLPIPHLATGRKPLCGAACRGVPATHGEGGR